MKLYWVCLGISLFTLLLLAGCQPLDDDSVGMAPSLPYGAEVLILAESPQRIEYKYLNSREPRLGGFSLQDAAELSTVHAWVATFILEQAYIAAGRPQAPWSIRDLGALTNRGSKNIYVLTATVSEPQRIRRILSKMYPKDKIWSNPWAYYRNVLSAWDPKPKEIIPAPDAVKVQAIVSRYRDSYEPIGVTASDFPGFTTIAPGETKAIVHKSIAPQLLEDSEIRWNVIKLKYFTYNQLGLPAH